MKLIAALYLIITCLLATPVWAATAADTVKITDAWVRSVPPVTSTTAAYMQLSNTGTGEHFLIGASSDIAANIELHRNSNVDGMMRMRHIVHVHIPGGTTVSLGAGGMHFMLFRLKQPLATGKTVDLRLEFADGSHKTITAEVK